MKPKLLSVAEGSVAERGTLFRKFHHGQAKQCFALLLLLTSLAVHAQTNYPSGTVFTIAGGGANYPGDGGQATNAAINPYGSAIGPDGSIYFADNFNSRIRRIAPNGIITTVAGDGSFGDTGDGGQATNATLSGVLAIAVDGARNVLYIGDIDNNRVRQVNLTNGIISNFAGTGTFGFIGDGGSATSARFRSIEGVAVDREGNVYIVDVINKRVRKVTITNGIINTIAGNGASGASSGDGGPATSARINFPSRVAVDDAANVFVVDTDTPSRRIRRVDAATRIITTVAGGGTNTPTSGPATSMFLNEALDIAVNRAGTTLFINDDHRVLKVNLATGQMSIFAGVTNGGFSGDGGLALNAQFQQPGGICLTPAGEIIVSDSGNDRLRYIVPDSVQLACNNSLTELRLPFVNFLSGDLAVENNSSITNVNAGGVTSVGGNVQVNGNDQLANLALGALNNSGSIGVTGNGQLANVDLGSLTNSASIDVTGNGQLANVAFGSLNNSGNIGVSGNGQLASADFGSLNNSGSINITGNGQLSSLALGSLDTVAGDLDISNNGSLTNVDLSSVTTVSNTAKSLTQSAHLFATNPAASDHFGFAVAISNNVLVATASEADLPGMVNAGAAFLFTNSAGSWSAPVKLTAGGFAGTDFRFGQCVALDGDTLMIGAADRLGAPGETWGAVYVFTRSGGTWPATPSQQLLSPQTNSPVNDFFGNAVSVSGDLAAIGEYLDSNNLGDTNAVGAVHIFRKSGGVWSAVQTILPPRPKLLGRFGASVALQGTKLLIGEPGADVTVCKTDAGAVWVYELDGSGTNFLLQTTLIASDSDVSDQFGYSVALDGTNAVIGAITADIGNATDAGAAYVFKRTAGVWREQSKLTASEAQTNGQFGVSVALRGNVAVVGATETPAGTGSGHAFTRDINGNWVSRRRKPTDQAVGDDFGGAVAFDGENVAWGARMDNTTGGTDAGSVYVDELDDLETVGGSVAVTNNSSATTIDLGALTSADGSVAVTNNSSATTIDLGALTSAGSVAVTNNSSATTIDLGALGTVDGSVAVTNNSSATTIDLGALTSAGSVAVTNNSSATTTDLGALSSVDGSVAVTNNSSATTIDLGALTTTGGDVDITGNSSATNINTCSLASVFGDLTIADNGTNTMVNLCSLTNVMGDFTIETHGQTNVNFTNVNVGVDTSIEAHGATMVSAMTAPGSTDVSLINGAASMLAALTNGTFASPVMFSVQPLSGAAVNEQPGTMDGQPVSADPVSAYQFNFATPTLNEPAQLTFDIYLPGFGTNEQASLLSAADAGHLTLAVKADAPGSEYQLFDVCGTNAPVLDTCARLSKLDTNGIALTNGSPIVATTLRLEGIVGHFSTYAAVTFTPTTPPTIATNRISYLTIEGGALKFSFLTETGKSYTVQYSDSLNPTNWLALTNFTGDGSIWRVSDPLPPPTPPFTQRYYRMLTQ